MPETARKETIIDVMYNRLEKILDEHVPFLGMDQKAELMMELAEGAFSVCGISEKGRREEW